MPFFSKNCRYPPKVFHSILYLISPCASIACFFMAVFNGPILSPSPITSSVTPWRISLWERPSSIRLSLAQLSMLIKPGDTAIPFASVSFLPVAAERLPIKAMVSALMPISALYGFSPLPSYIIPLRIMLSYCSFCLQENRMLIAINSRLSKMLDFIERNFKEA